MKPTDAHQQLHAYENTTGRPMQEVVWPPLRPNGGTVYVQRPQSEQVLGNDWFVRAPQGGGTSFTRAEDNDD